VRLGLIHDVPPALIEESRTATLLYHHHCREKAPHWPSRGAGGCPRVELLTSEYSHHYARLRVKDIDFATNQVIVRCGKGAKDRVTVLPAVVKAALAGISRG
jgi:hypothetical protein